MEDWEVHHIKNNRSQLLRLTDANVELLAHLNQILSEHDTEVVLSKGTSQERAHAFWTLAIQKHNGYEKIARALQASKQTGALEIILKGYSDNKKPIPAWLDVKNLDVDDDNVIEWQGKVLTLKELLRTDSQNDGYQNLLKELKKCPHSKPIQILKPQMHPGHPTYYIPRALSYFSSFELNDSIFASESTWDHTFLFEGANKEVVVRLTKTKKRIGTSWNQLRKLTTRFILLECTDHFERICSVASKPVHLIQYTNNRYFWIKSSGGLEVVQQFFKCERKKLEGTELLSKLQSDFSPTIIADTPGMGKTLLLSALAGLLSDKQDNIVIFIVLEEFIREIQLMDQSSTTSPIDAIDEYSSPGQVAKLILLELLKGETRKIYLCFDGYDEVSRGILDTVDKFLQRLKALSNIKVIVTTRPHLKNRLENMFSQFSYQILPFSESNQIEFLTNFWTNHAEYPAVNSNVLLEYAKGCLKALEMKLTDREKEITGIPLQCMILGEVYAEDAKSASTMKTLSHNAVTPISIFHMYKKLVDLKLKKVSSSRFKKYLKIHIYLALELLFQEWSKVFKPILKPKDDADHSVLYSIGLVEHTRENTPRFIHRTFAEYLLAGFIVKKLGKHQECEDLLFRDILGQGGVTIETGKDGPMWITAVSNYYLKHPVIGYFIEMCIKEHISHYPNEKLLPPYFFMTRLFRKPKFNKEDICVAVGACCSNDLEYTLDYVTKVLHRYPIADDLRDKYFKEMAHVVAHHSNNLTLLEKVLAVSKSKFMVGIGFHELHCPERDFELYIQNYTPLHVAVLMGKFHMVQWLTEQYNKLGYQWDTMKCLLHLCVRWSTHDGAYVLEDKMLIIDMLAKINPGWINERDSRTFTPVVESNAHINLLNRLVQNGADVNEYWRYRETGLLHSLDTSKYQELVQWAFSNGFVRVNEAGFRKRTALMNGIMEFSSVDDHVLKLFHDKGVNWNAQDEFGFSVLFFALQYSETVEFINRIIEYGADVNHLDRRQRSAAIVAFENKLLNSQELLKVLRILESNGFRRWGHKDLWGRTSQEVARTVRKQDDELHKFLKERVDSQFTLNTL